MWYRFAAFGKIDLNKYISEDLSEDFIHSLQRHVEVDEPEAEAAPALTPATGVDFDGEAQFDRMTEEDLLRGLEGLVPPAEVEEEGE